MSSDPTSSPDGDVVGSRSTDSAEPEAAAGRAGTEAGVSDTTPNEFVHPNDDGTYSVTPGDGTTYHGDVLHNPGGYDLPPNSSITNGPTSSPDGDVVGSRSTDSAEPEAAAGRAGTEAGVSDTTPNEFVHPNDDGTYSVTPGDGTTYHGDVLHNPGGYDLPPNSSITNDPTSSPDGDVVGSRSTETNSGYADDRGGRGITNDPTYEADHPDATVVHGDGDGTITTERPGGTATTTSANGTSSDSGPGGTNTYYPGDTYSHQAPDGTTYTGSSTPSGYNDTPDQGQAITNDPTYEVAHPDATVVQGDGQGGVTTERPGGTATTSSANGTSTDSGPGGTNTYYPGDTYSHQAPDGTTYTGSSTPSGYEDTSDQGQAITNDPTYEADHPDATVVHGDGQGGVTTERPNGTATTASANGTSSDSGPEGTNTYYPGDTYSHQGPDGTTYTGSSTPSGYEDTPDQGQAITNDPTYQSDHPDATVVHGDGDGTITTERPGGTSTATAANGTSTDSGPEGTNTYYPGDTYSHQGPDGTTYTGSNTPSGYDDTPDQGQGITNDPTVADGFPVTPPAPGADPIGSNDGPTQPDGTTVHTPAPDSPPPPLFRDGVERISTEGDHTFQDDRGATTVNTDGSETSVTNDGRAFTDQTDGSRTGVGPIDGGNDSHIVNTDFGTTTTNLDGSKDSTYDGKPLLHENPDGSGDIPKRP